MHAKVQKEHEWLRQFVGEWTYEFEASEPGQPPTKHVGTESVRMLGDVWLLFEGRIEQVDGSTDLTQMTLGYDAAKGRYVGTYIGSMMTYLWLYTGTLNASGTVLTLECEGPGMTPDAPMAKYKDAIVIKDNDHRLLTSTVLGEDGTWTPFMTTEYRRK